MSIANLYGKTPAGPLYNNSALATKTYIPGGVMLSSPLFEPASGFRVGNVANGSRVKVFYTKIGNLVTITCRFFVGTAGATEGDAIQEIHSNQPPPAVPAAAAAVGLFNAANLGPDIVAQLNNDILVKDMNAAAVTDPVALKIPGFLVNATDGTPAFANIRPGEIQITATGVADTVLPQTQQYFSGSASFVAQNAAIVV